MVSDIVLLKELPDFIKESIDAYAACVGGAMVKDEYIGAIKKAGFKDVKIAGEVHFPVEFMANDPTVKAAIEALNAPMEELMDVAASIVSIKVQATKLK
jgi:hypothetical protein